MVKFHALSETLEPKSKGQVPILIEIKSRDTGAWGQFAFPCARAT